MKLMVENFLSRNKTSRSAHSVMMARVVTLFSRKSDPAEIESGAKSLPILGLKKGAWLSWP